MLTITLRAAKEADACVPSYTAVRRALGRRWKLDDPLPLARVLEIRGLNDTLWALQCVPQDQGDERRRVVSLWLAALLERVRDQMKDESSRAIIPLLREHAVTPVSSERWARALSAARAALSARASSSWALSSSEWASGASRAEQQWQVARLRYYLTEEES